MKETPPPFHSRRRTRTRPAHRRTPVEPGPDLGRFRSRLSRTSVILAAFIAIVGLGTAAVRQSSREATPPSPPPAVASAGAPTSGPAGGPAGAVPVAVTRVIDGDTLDVRAAETELRVRLYGVDTPERGEACYGEATARLRTLAGDRVLLLADARTQDRYGRELRDVFTTDGRSIDAALVTEGLALAWREDGSRRAELIAAEEAART
ncbi:MAG: thermonuclease family protein, partial [Dehalococcoidia bacterium]